MEENRIKTEKNNRLIIFPRPRGRGGAVFNLAAIVMATILLMLKTHVNVGPCVE